MKNFDPKEYLDSLALREGDIPIMEKCINQVLDVYTGATDLLASIMSTLGSPLNPPGKPRYYPEKIKLDLPITDRCNLSCASCSHFAPLAKDAPMIPKEDIDASLLLLKEACPNEVGEIFILGGEPLLHPELTDIITIARRRFMNAAIYVVTNMLALNENIGKLSTALRDNMAHLAYSKYGTVNEKQVEEGVRDIGRCGIATILFGEDPAQFTSYMKSEKPIFPASMKPSCQMKTCLTLRGPYLYLCSPVTYLEYPNRAFGMHLEASRYDRINLRDVEHGHEVMALSKLPNPFCRHCDVEHNHKIGWRPSRKERSEWFLA